MGVQANLAACNEAWSIECYQEPEWDQQAVIQYLKEEINSVAI